MKDVIKNNGSERDKTIQNPMAKANGGRINQELVSMFSHYQPIPADYISVEVDLEPSVLLDVLARETAAEVARLVPYAEHPILETLSEERIVKYFRTLIKWRVAYTMDDAVTTKAYKPIVKNVAIPSLFYQLIVAIGVTSDRDYGITFKPAYSIKRNELLSLEEMSKISDAILSMRRYGFCAVEGMPREKDGELGFMAMSNVEGTIRSYRHDATVYAFLAAFFAHQKLEATLGTKLLIRYGQMTEFEIMVRAATRLLSTKSQ